MKIECVHNSQSRCSTVVLNNIIIECYQWNERFYRKESAMFTARQLAIALNVPLDSIQEIER